MQYAVITPEGRIIHDPGWGCVADVVHAQHGLGLTIPGGALLARETPADPWAAVHPIPEGGAR